MTIFCTLTVHGREWSASLGNPVADAPNRRDVADLSIGSRSGISSCEGKEADRARAPFGVIRVHGVASEGTEGLLSVPYDSGA